MRKVLLLSKSYYGQITGGAEYQQHIIAQELVKRGYDVSYLFIDNGSFIRNSGNITLLPVRDKTLLRKFLGPYYFLELPKIYTILERIEPDVILARTGFSYIGAASRYCNDKGCKLIWHVSSNNSVNSWSEKPGIPMLHKRPFYWIDRKLKSYGITRADKIICQSEHQKVLLRENFGRVADAIVPNFHPLPKDKIEKNLPIKIIWIANFKRIKQPDIFIRLAKHFSDQQNLRFQMVGRPSSGVNMEKYYKEIKKLPHLEYFGELTMNEVNRLLNSAHIFVNTSMFEGFPNTFIQAWMRRVPVVSLQVDPDNLLEKNTIGYRSGNFEKMIRDIGSLTEDMKLLEDMGKRAQQFAFSNYTVENNIDKILNLFS